MNLKHFLIVLAAQTALLLALIAQQEYALAAPTTVLLETAPVDPDADPATDPAVIATDEPAPTDVAVDLPSLDGLFQMDSDGFDLDLTVLEVGRALGQFGFTDLP